MALRVWLPLNGNLENKGLTNAGFTNAAGATVSDAGKIGKCYNFAQYTGSGICLSTGPSAESFMNSYINNHSFSLCAWVKTNTSNNRNTPIMYLTYGVPFYAGYNCGITLAVSGSTVASVNITNTTNDGSWHHVVATHDKDKREVSIYFDGVLKKSQTYTGDPYVSPWKNNIFIGRNPNNTTQNDTYFFHGDMNDVRIYDHCLSPREVKEISRGLVLHYKLDDPYIEPTENYFTPAGNYSSWSSFGFGSKGTKTEANGQTPNRTNKYCIVGSSSTTNATAEMARTASIGSVNTGGKVTFSCYVRGVGATIGRSGFLHVYNTNGTTSKSVHVANFTFTADWVRVSGQFEWTAEAASGPNFTGYVAASSMKSGETYEFCEPQIELKDHATPYTPSSRSAVPVYDCSGYKNDGTINGTLTLSDDSPRFGRATTFNGTSGNTSTIKGVLNLSSDFKHTASFWIKPKTIGDQTRWIFSIANGSTSNTQFGCYLSMVKTINTEVGGVVNTTWTKWDQQTLSANTQYHIAIVSDGTNVTVYINGTALGSVAKNGTNTGSTFWIGQRSGSPGAMNYDGILSDFRIYSTALSADDIKELYNTSALIHNDGTIEAFEFVETDSGSPEVTKTGLVKAQSHNEVELYDYIESTGTQWIDTGIVPSNSTRVDIKFNYTTTANLNLFGTNAVANKSYILNIYNTNLEYNYYNTGWKKNISVTVGSDIELSFNKQHGIYINSTKVTTLPDSSFESNENMYLFVRNRGGSALSGFYVGKIYYFRVYDNDVLIRNFIPCKYGSAAGMWDTVEGKFYSNAGTGSFTVGSPMSSVAALYTNKTEASQLVES